MERKIRILPHFKIFRENRGGFMTDDGKFGSIQMEANFW